MRRRAVLIVAALSLFCSGCSIASQRNAVVLPSSLHLISVTTTTLPAQSATNELSVYFLKDGRLSPVTGYYSTDPLSVAVAVLSNGPSGPQLASGISTAFVDSPAVIRPTGPFTPGVTALVEIDTSFLNLPVVALEEASAQIVYTLTGLPNAPSKVRFIIDGQKLESLIPPGKLVNRDVSRLDYCQFAPLNYKPCFRSTVTH